MSCFGCASKFGFLTKEHGCPSCGFSYCGSCLKFKIVVPKHDNKIKKVCKSCFNIASDSTKADMDQKQSFNPPDNFLRRLETLDNPPNPPITIYHDEPRLQNLLMGLNSTDLDIALRLRRLRDDRRKARHVPTEEELASRLAKLRDQDSNTVSKGPSFTAYTPPDTRTRTEEANDLMNQVVKAVAETKPFKPEDDIARRLMRLREENEKSSGAAVHGSGEKSSGITLDEVSQLLSQCKMDAGEGGTHPDLATIVSLEQIHTLLSKHKNEMEQGCPSDDEGDAIQRIIDKATAEVELEQRLGIKTQDEAEDMEEEHVNEELPWCVICNENAVLRCLDCDRDLYCRDCFKQGHKDADMCAHVAETFQHK